MQSRAKDTLTVWTEESGRDRRNTRWAVIAAVALHAVFFRLQLPETVAAERTPRKPVVFPIQVTRFEPPAPREQQTLPEPRARRMPWPDPTPEDPEPLAVTTRVASALALPDGDLVLNLPSAPPPLPAAGPLPVGGDVLAPVKTHSPPPRYTEIARKARIQGKVIVEAVIDATGAVSRVRLVEDLPMGLGDSAMEAVRGWRFEPATLGGKPVAVIYRLEVHFRLH